MVTFFLVNPERKVSSIGILVSFRGKKYKRSIRESTPVKFWNKTKKRVRETTDNPEGQLANDRITKWQAAADRTISHFKEYLNAPSSQTFFAQLDREYYKDADQPSGPSTFIEYLQAYIARYKDVRRKTTVNNYNLLLKNLKDFEADTRRTLTFENINIDFYNDFQVWFYGKKYSENYFGSQVKIIKQVYREARVIDKLHKFTETEHKEFRTIKKESHSIYLTVPELHKIHTLELTPELIRKYHPEMTDERMRSKLQSLPIIRDRFIIGAFTGLRVSDFGKLSKANIGDYIRVTTTKTREPVVIPIHPIVREILDAGFDPSVMVSDQKINEHIKELAQYAEINTVVHYNRNEGGKIITESQPKYKMVTAHTARRSFATNAYKAGVPTLVIMKILGHKSEATFLKYIKVSAEENAEILMRHEFFTKPQYKTADTNAGPNDADSISEADGESFKK